MIATFLPAGALSYLYYADRIYQLPVGVIGIALGTLLLPDIARRASFDDTDGMRRASDRALRLCIAVAAPVGVLLLFFGDWIMLLLFARGAFDAADAEASARVLAAYSIGMIPALAVRSLVAGFHGRGDLRAPFLLLLAATAVNVLLKVLLVEPLGIAGLAVATAIALWIYIGALFAVARRREYASSVGRRLALVTLPVVGLGVLLHVSRNWIRLGGAELADPLGLALSLGTVAGILSPLQGSCSGPMAVSLVSDLHDRSVAIDWLGRFHIAFIRTCQGSGPWARKGEWVELGAADRRGENEGQFWLRRRLTGPPIVELSDPIRLVAIFLSCAQ